MSGEHGGRGGRERSEMADGTQQTHRESPVDHDPTTVADGRHTGNFGVAHKITLGFFLILL